MSGQRRFKQYLSIIPPSEREGWIVAHLGQLSDETEALRKEVAKLKARCTRLERKNRL